MIVLKKKKSKGKKRRHEGGIKATKVIDFEMNQIKIFIL